MDLDTEHVIHAQLEVEGCTAELWLNGIPITRLGPHTAPLESRAAQQFLVAGTNRIELLVEPGRSPSCARTDVRERRLEGARAVGRLLRFEDGTIPDAEFGETLAEVTYRSEEDRSPADRFPRSLFAERDLGGIVGRWAYEDAPILSMEEALIDEAHAALEAIAEAIRQGSTARFLELLEVQVREAARAYPALTEEYLREDLTKLLADYHRAKEPVVPLDRERHDFRLVAGGRMIECVDVDWRPSLMLRDPDVEVEAPYAIFLARIEGKLRVVR
jgi:hypothetical protein